MKNESLSTEEVCIVGSAVFALNGGRKNNDLDFTITPSDYKNFKQEYNLKINYYGHVEIADHIDIYKNRYSIINIDDKMLFNDNLYTYYQGFKIVRIEVEYVYKLIKSRKKDIEDLREFEKNSKIYNEMDWEWIERLLINYRKNSNYRKYLYRLDKVINDPHILIKKAKRKIKLT